MNSMRKFCVNKGITTKELGVLRGVLRTLKQDGFDPILWRTPKFRASLRMAAAPMPMYKMKVRKNLLKLKRIIADAAPAIRR